jgi:hypothetical protein
MYIWIALTVMNVNIEKKNVYGANIFEKKNACVVNTCVMTDGNIAAKKDVNIITIVITEINL